MKSTGSKTKLRTQMKQLLLLAAVLASLVLLACGDDNDAATSGDDSAVAEGDAGAAQDSASGGDQGGPQREQGGSGSGGQGGSGTEIFAADSQFGQVLFGAGQQAIYYFDKETTQTPECFGACAEAWPPVLTDGDPRAGEGIEGELLGTTERDDGSTQVTYADRPLYYYVDDPPNQVLCHDVEEFGGLWLAVQPNGEPVP
jgi:predicted lipoprotein with Yx(FWY)xxD motif